MNIKEYLKKRRSIIDNELDELLPAAGEHPKVIHKAMRYSMKGGKRIRPILCMAACEAAGGSFKKAKRTACAIEMIHGYSLIHDDLPSMDNDDFRRGQQTSHKKFGEAHAVLAGDALLTEAFGVLANATPDPAKNVEIIKVLAHAAGTYGMVGGQAIDISGQDKTAITLEYINIHKTGALIAAACKTGAIAAGASKKDIKALFRFGEYIGLVFQYVDDVIDGDGMANLYGPKRAYEHGSLLTAKALGCLAPFKKKAQALYAISDFILKRKV